MIPWFHESSKRRFLLYSYEKFLAEFCCCLTFSMLDSMSYKWLQVLGTTETPDIDQGVRHQFHPVVTLLDVLETEEQPLEFVLPRKRPLDSLP
jgi:hypothetical protein